MPAIKSATRAPCSVKPTASCWYFARLESSRGPKTQASDRLEPARNRRGIHRACVARGLLAATEHDHRRDAAYVETRCGRGLILGIQLRKTKLGFQCRRARLVIRRHGDARPAPRRPEIDDQRQIAAADVLVEIGGGQLDGLAREQGMVAFRAARGILQTIF